MKHKGSLREGVRNVRKWEELQDECGVADVGKAYAFYETALRAAQPEIPPDPGPTSKVHKFTKHSLSRPIGRSVRVHFSFKFTVETI